tara:strand:- start:812 stop:2464 length:1653 start_codon:yes stop_codon:yes gene_type:complete
MAKRYIVNRRQRSSIPFVFQMNSLAYNGGKETLTAKPGYTLNSQVIGGGFSTEYTNYIISGNGVFNKAVAVATLEIKAGDKKYISKSPYLSGNYSDNIKLVLKKIDKDLTGVTNKQRNAYTFDVYYINKEVTQLSDGLVCDLVYSCQPTGYRDNIIDFIKTGFENTGQLILPGRNASIVKVIGKPGSSFALDISEHLLDVELEEDGSTPTGRIIYNKDNSTSILSSDLQNHTLNLHGKSRKILKDIIPQNGVYQFQQEYPTYVLITNLDGAVSNSPNLNLANSTDDLKAGDSVFIKGYRDRCKVVSASSKAVTLDKNFTAPDNAVVKIMRDRKFSVEILPDLSSPLGPDIPTSNHIELSHHKDILVTFKISKAGGGFTITHEKLSKFTLANTSEGDVYGTASDAPSLMYKLTEFSTTGLGVGDPHTNVVPTLASGITNRSVQVSYSVKLLAASGGFSTVRVPTFSNTIPNSLTKPGTPSTPQPDGGSDWTNTIPSQNGGTIINAYGAEIEVSTASSANDTCVINLSFNLERGGLEDVVLELDLDKILTIT